MLHWHSSRLFSLKNVARGSGLLPRSASSRRMGEADDTAGEEKCGEELDGEDTIGHEEGKVKGKRESLARFFL